MACGIKVSSASKSRLDEVGISDCVSLDFESPR